MNYLSLRPKSIFTTTGLALALGLLASCESLDQGSRDTPSEPIRHSDPIRVEPPAGNRVVTGDRYKVEEPKLQVIRPNVVLPEEEPVASSGRRRSTTRRAGSPRSGVESVRPPERRDRTRVIRDPYTGIIPTGTVDANKGGNVTTIRR